MMVVLRRNSGNEGTKLTVSVSRIKLMIVITVKQNRLPYNTRVQIDHDANVKD